MRLIRFGNPGQERPGFLLHDGTRVDASSFARDAGGDWNEAFFGGDGLERLSAFAAREGARLPRVAPDVRLGPAVARPSKIICVGLNFVDHARETKAELPKEPVLFFKASSAWSGPDDDLVLPRGSEKTDYEVELAIVIGKRAKHVAKERALDHVAGLALHNDYSERYFQLERGGQWVKGKSCDTFAPFGPFLATLDELGDFRSLGMWLKVNGESRQSSNTSNMVCDVPGIVAYVSQFMSLLPGDVISTGTPAGVGLGFQPPKYLKAGDVVECGIERLGSQRQRIVPEATA